MYTHAVILSMSYCLPVCCLTSNETLKPVKLRYIYTDPVVTIVKYRSHPCTALEKAGANYLKLTSMKLYYLISGPSSQGAKHARQTQITRAITNLENPLPRYENNFGYGSFFCSGTVNWNGIPLHFHSSSLVSFKRLYKNFSAVTVWGKDQTIGLPQDKARKSQVPFCLLVVFFLFVHLLLHFF